MNHTEIPDKNMVSDNYRRIGDRYVYLYDSENAHRYLNKAMTMITDTLDGYTYGGLLHSFSQLYKKVSIEPELSLQHSLHSVQVMSDFLIRSKDKLMANQIQVEFDMICNTWDKCYELFDYLGNSSDALACLDKKWTSLFPSKGKSILCIYGQSRIKSTKCFYNMHSLKNVTYRNAEHSMIRYWLYWNIIKTMYTMIILILQCIIAL